MAPRPSGLHVTSTNRPTGDEWHSRFTRYVDQSADRLRQSTDLNRQLTRRIAHGDVPPVVVESHLAGFLSRNVESYANDMSGVALHFLSELVDVNADYVRELLGNVAPDEHRHDLAAPPSFDPSDAVGWYERLIEYAATRSAATAALMRTAVGARYDETDMTDDAGPAVVHRLADAFLALMARVDEITADYGYRYMEEVLAFGVPAQRAEAPVSVVADLGDTATVKFAVCNTTASTATIRCVMTDLRRSDGVGPAFEPTATITPSQFRLAAGREEAVTLSIVLEEPAFVPGPTYTGSIRVLGVGDHVVGVPIELRASLAAHELSAAEPS
jgi:hypothetical protein